MKALARSHPAFVSSNEGVDSQMGVYESASLSELCMRLSVQCMEQGLVMLEASVPRKDTLEAEQMALYGVLVDEVCLISWWVHA